MSLNKITASLARVLLIKTTVFLNTLLIHQYYTKQVNVKLPLAAATSKPVAICAERPAARADTSAATRAAKRRRVVTAGHLTTTWHTATRYTHLGSIELFLETWDSRMCIFSIFLL